MIKSFVRTEVFLKMKEFNEYNHIRSMRSFELIRKVSLQHLQFCYRYHLYIANALYTKSSSLIIFWKNPDFATEHFIALHSAQFSIVLNYFYIEPMWVKYTSSVTGYFTYSNQSSKTRFFSSCMKQLRLKCIGKNWKHTFPSSFFLY